MIEALKDDIASIMSFHKTSVDAVTAVLDAINGTIDGAAADVLNERFRQVEKEGYTARHDDEHDAGELAGAGSAYALNAACQLYPHYALPLDEKPDSFIWPEEYWKPKSPREDLVRAAALLIAEIDRIDRHDGSAVDRIKQTMCKHEGYDFKKHGRCCPHCKTVLTDFGD